MNAQEKLFCIEFRLKEVEWTQQPDAKISDEKKALIAAYIADLQAMESNPNFPDVQFPDYPF